MPGETEKRGAAGRKGGMGFRPVGLSGFRAAEGADRVLGRPPSGAHALGTLAPDLQGGLIPGRVLVPSSSRPSRSTHQQ